MKQILLYLFILINCSCFAQKLHDPSEILDILEKSKLNYEIHQLEEKIPLKNHTFNLNSADFYRKIQTNSIATIKIELTKEAFNIKEEAETFFQQQKYTEARIAYEKVLALHPEYSKITTYIGQTYHFQGNEKKAIKHYKKAIDNNFIDYMAHWFLGKYYLNKNQLDKALDELIIAHILNRNHQLIINDLSLVLKKLGYNYPNWTFNPQIRLSTQDSQNIKIEYQKEWMGYALAKATWAFEPGYSQSMGVKKGEISILEEREALVGLLINVSDKKFSKTPMFKALKNALEQKQVDAFIFYEIFLVETPFIAYQIPDNLINEIKNYIIESRCLSTKKKKRKK